MRGLPQAENGGKMRRGARKFAGARVIIGFGAIYAPLAMALAQTRPLQHAPGLVQALCYAALGTAWIMPVMRLIRWMEKPDPGT
ncbi:MAG: DUF2842 domain-containing protein [Methylocella sp.]